MREQIKISVKRSGIFKAVFIIILISGCFTSVYAQDNSVLFFSNPYSFNPSYAGVEGRPAFYLDYRKQWVNVEGSPQIGNLSFHTPLKKFVSVGANIHNDKRGLFNTTSGLISGAYTVVLGDFKSLRFGISAGGGISSIDLKNVTDITDPALLNGGNSFLQGSAGLSLHLKSFHGGITLPSIFQPSYVSGTSSTLNPLQTLIIHASNRFYWNKNKHVLEPHLIYRYHNVQPSQLEMALVYHVNNVLWVGGSYKQAYGNSAFMGFHFNHNFGLGYAYTFKTANGLALNSPSHEIQLTLLLGEKKKDIPFYSFVDTDKEKRIQHHKTIPASAAIAQNRANKDAAKTTPPVVKKEAPKKTEPVVVKPQEKKTEVAQQAPPEPPVKTPEPPKVDTKALSQMPLLHDTLQPEHKEEKERIARLANPTEASKDTVVTKAVVERHEFVKKGNHAEELDIGDYVIAGVFRSKVNAQHFANGLGIHGYKADHGHLTEKNLWYVYLIKTDSIDKAREERDKLRKMLIFRDAWLLTVHH